MVPSSQPSQATPAQLSFLTIYNPSLGKKNRSLAEQIVFYASRTKDDDPDPRGKRLDVEDVSREQENEQLRQVGLAQAMVSFAKNFSGEEAIDTIETEKSRIVLCELEPSWWILCSIDLTRLPSRRSKNAEKPSDEGLEVSSRELSPANLILQQLRRAHSIFILHHGPSLDILYSETSRDIFCETLSRYWTRFAFSWEPLLHGNPAVEIYGGTKLAGGGELGVGVGEEEWGSGEREVLEDFMNRTKGLQDLIVSRFGNPPIETSKLDKARPAQQQDKKDSRWLGTEAEPGVSDGVIFSGIGAIAKHSIASLSYCIEDVYRYGNKAYAIRSHTPSTLPNRKRVKSLPGKQSTRGASSPRKRPTSTQREKQPPLAPPGVPPSLVRIAEQSPAKTTVKVRPRTPSKSPEGGSGAAQEKKPEEGEQDTSGLGTDKMIKYLSLGYGSAWTLNPRGFQKTGEEASAQQTSLLQSPNSHGTEGPSRESSSELPPSLSLIEPMPEISDEDIPFIQYLESSIGTFLIGLPGDLENQDLTDEAPDLQSAITARSVTVHTTASPTPATLRLVIYTHQPFIFTFLFAPDTTTLSSPSFYRSIHHHLGPLQKSLLRSTSAATAMARIAQATSQHLPTPMSNPIFSLLYNPTTHTTLSNIPTIPPLIPIFSPARPITVSGSWYTLGIPTGSSTSTSVSPTQPTSSSLDPSQPVGAAHLWSRAEALAAHTQIINTHQATRSGERGRERERMSKNGRGWWVLWMRVEVGAEADKAHEEGGAMEAEKEAEAVLVRKARDGGASGRRVGGGVGKRWLGRERGEMDGAAGTAGGGGVAGMSEGVGVDAARWVDGLMGLTR